MSASSGDQTDRMPAEKQTSCYDPVDEDLIRAHQALMGAIIEVRKLGNLGVNTGYLTLTCWDAAEQLCMLADSLGRSLDL